MGDGDEEVCSRSGSDRRICHARLSLGRRTVFRGSQYHHPYMFGGDQNGNRHENDGKVQDEIGGREGYGRYEGVQRLIRLRRLG